MLSWSDSVNKLHLVSPSAEGALLSLGIKTLRDLVYHYPRQWQDLSDVQPIATARPGENLNVRAAIKKLSEHRTKWRRMHLTEATLEDETGTIAAVWFNQPFLKRVLKPGKAYYFTGKVQNYESKGRLQLQNPAFELVKEETIHTAGIVPVYPLTEGITQKQIRYWMSQALQDVPALPDHLPVPLLAPTEILAWQHYQTLQNLLNHADIPIALLTRSRKTIHNPSLPPLASRGETTPLKVRGVEGELLKGISSGETKVIIGTHALLQENVRFRKIGLLIVDEQHRFGVKQRGTLLRAEDRELVPHLLSMTATPIPRTLALTLYGDLDISMLRELPKGRKKIITRLVAPENRPVCDDLIEKKRKEGRQMYVAPPPPPPPLPPPTGGEELKEGVKAAT